MKTIIYSPYDALIKTKNEEVFLNRNEHMILEEENQSIVVYPTNKMSRYSFTIDLNEQHSIFYSVIKKDNDTLVFLLDGIIAENVDIYSFSNEGQTSFVEIGKTQIVFKTQSHEKIVTPPTKIDEFKCGNFKHINYVVFGDQTKTYATLYNTKTNKIKLLQADEIEIKEDGFVLTTNKNSFYRKIVEEYLINNQGLKIKSRVFSQKENYPHNFVSYMFMNSIKFKDYHNAYYLLSDYLKGKLSVDALKNYFGDVTYFYTIDSLTIFAISDGKNIIYEFSINDNKISEITDNLT